MQRKGRERGFFPETESEKKKKWPKRSMIKEKGIEGKGPFSL